MDSDLLYDFEKKTQQPKMVDLRSDTNSRAPQEMLEAMVTAEVGDDVFSDDPTALKLEETAAQMFGK